MVSLDGTDLFLVIVPKTCIYSVDGHCVLTLQEGLDVKGDTKITNTSPFPQEARRNMCINNFN